MVGLKARFHSGAEDLIQSVDLQDNVQMRNQLQLKIKLLQDLIKTVRDGEIMAQLRSEHMNKRVKLIHKINSHLPLIDPNFVSSSPPLGGKRNNCWYRNRLSEMCFDAEEESGYRTP